MLLKTLNRICRPDIAIDLGTATTRVAVGHRRYRFSAPSSCGSVHALAKGVIVNVDAATETLRPALHRLRQQGIAHPRALACAPTDVTDDEREAIRETCFRAGAVAVLLMPEPLAAALGDGIDYRSPFPTMILDIGEGVTDCAVIREGRLAANFARRVACADLRTAVQEAVRSFRAISLTDHQAARLVYETGVRPSESGAEGETMPLLRFLTVPDTLIADEVRIPLGVLQEAMEPVVDHILETAQSLFVEIPTLHDALGRAAIRLTGGGALIPGFATRLARSLGRPVQVVRNPLEGLVMGARRVLPLADRFDLWPQTL